jgi:hypothetical protein
MPKSHVAFVNMRVILSDEYLPSVARMISTGGFEGTTTLRA